MTVSQLPLAAPAHRNQQLFSDYYLNEKLPQRADWQALTAAAASVLAKLKAIYAAHPVPNFNEAQTEDYLIKPTLEALGHTFEIQASLRTPDGTKKPDYIFYRDTIARDALRNTVLDDTLPTKGGIAVGDAKYWDRPLDTTLKVKGGDAFSNKNPAFQIHFYMQHSNAEWGILTNGRLWRLYHKDTAHKLDRYYEIDLPALLEQNDPAAFLYFYAFFHRSAFDDHPLSLRSLLRASAEFARGISENLKQQVYNALRHIAQGFLDYTPNGLSADPATLKTIYDHSLIVLYRLLFVLYAEARELLPVRESDQYRRRYSLHAIKREIAGIVASGEELLPDSTLYWPRLRQLFSIINLGSPPLKVATFNGGLFDPAKYPFLETKSIGDARLLQALDMLARVDGAFIDYRDLAERHLGTIYEGLLEYHLEAITPEDGWTVALLNDKGERKATGSYYTPDYIVKYIVDQTVGPALRSAVEGLDDDAAQIRAVLAVNVCDPAMGSGHFLVEATEYIARFLVDLAVTPDDGAGEPDLAYWKRRVAQSCIYGVDLNPLAVDLAKLSLWLVTVAKDRPLSFLDHHLRCGNALIGARLADLDIGGVAPKQRGPSKKAQAAVAAGQLTLLGDDAFRQSMSAAVGSMGRIESSAGNTVAEVKEQEQLYADLRSELTRKYGRLANLDTAKHFGLNVPADLSTPLKDYATGRAMAAVRPIVELLERADTLADERRFFHWELEFPEVFFDSTGQPLGDAAGFDAVVGNPPYVRQEQLSAFKPVFQALYPETYHGMTDLYVYFYQQGVRLLQSGGRMTYIVTNKWFRAGYGEGLRGFFAEQTVLEQIIDFGHAPIFEDADVFPCIVVVQKPNRLPSFQPSTHPVEERLVQVTSFPREALKLVSLDSYIKRYSYAVPQRRLGRAAWSLETSAVDDLMEKIRCTGVPLAEFAGVKPYRGVLTGFNEAFLIDTATKERLVREDPRSAEIIKPYLRGQDIKRWSSEWDGLWLIQLKSSGDYPWPWSNTPDQAEAVFAQTYPSLYAFMKPFETKLRQRQDKGRYWWELRACAYYAAFEQPKLMYQEIQFYPVYSIDNTGYFCNNKVFFLAKSDLYLLAVLNSPLLWWHNWRFLPHMKDEALNPAGFLIEQLPIAPPTDAIRAEVEPAVARLIAITQADQTGRRDTLDWLRVEFGVEKAGQKLEAFASLSEAEFVEEVRKRRPKAAGSLTPAGLRALREGYTEQALPIQHRAIEAQALEQRLSALVNAAYGLTPEDEAVLWDTAPPRMPLSNPLTVPVE